METEVGLTQVERETLEAAVERLIPADETSSGAHEAGAARYICRALATDYAHHEGSYRRGLAALDDTARILWASRFADLSPQEQDAVLRRAEFDGNGQGAMPNTFFELLRQHTLEGVFGDPAWGGNERRIGWELLGYPGPRPVWTYAEQRLTPLARPRATEEHGTIEKR